MRNPKFRLGEEVNIKTSVYGIGLIVGFGYMEFIEGGECYVYLVFTQGERKGYFSEFELEKIPEKK